MSYTHSDSKFALIDCNNFYVSCERIFNPALERKPVVILSNNDGCVISRSNEAKALGIAMAVPLFQIKSIIKQYQVHALSSNYTLYGDISQRVMYVLGTLWPKLEVYSIDEAFLDLQGLKTSSIKVFSHELTHRVQQWTGIPITLGSGPTKTLAKVANYFAKKRGLKSFDLADELTIDLVLARMDVKEVWGVGYRWAKALAKLGVKTALDLKKQDPLWIRNKFNKILSSTVLELQGIVSTEFEEEQKSKKSLVVSRSFAKILEDISPIKECLAHHATRAAEKLRTQAQVAQGMTVFIQTSRFDQSTQNYHWSKTFNLPGPTDNTSSIIHHALGALTELYQENRAYTKVGVMLYNLSPKKKAQLGFWQNELPKGEELMTVLDKVNKSFGRNTLRFAASSAPKLKAESKSPCYTTNWQQLPIVLAGHMNDSFFRRA